MICFKCFYFIVFCVFLGVLKLDASSKLEGEASAVQVERAIPEAVEFQLKGLQYYQDSYKNIVVTVDHLSFETISKLHAVIEEMRRSYKNHALYVRVREMSSRLEDLGFKLYELDTEAKALIYLYKNGRNIPELNYAYTAAAVYLLRTNPDTQEKEILLINEPQKVIANIIGGISEKGESPEDTVVREVREEVGLIVHKDKLKLVAVFHTIRPDKKSCVEFLYVCDEFEGVPQVDGVEVSECAWISLSKIQEVGMEIFGKPFYSLWQKVLKDEFKNQEYGAKIASTKMGYQCFSPVS